MPDYERLEPEKTVLHQVVREGLESFVARARQSGSPVARFVEREIRACLDCGIPAHGFLRVHCDDGGCDRLVAFSCKGRGFCPSCGGRRMAAGSRSDPSASGASLRRDAAAHLVERVLPEVPIRRRVFTMPYPLRLPCAWDAKLTSAVLRAFLRSVFADQRRRAEQVHGVRNGQCAAVTFIQRFAAELRSACASHASRARGSARGFGHRVYKSFDPRARILGQAADEVLADLGVADPLLEIAKRIEEVVLADEYTSSSATSYPNVDFYSGVLYRAKGSRRKCPP